MFLRKVFHMMYLFGTLVPGSATAATSSSIKQVLSSTAPCIPPNITASIPGKQGAPISDFSAKLV